MLDAETMPYVDVTAVTMLEQLADELRLRGITLDYAREVGQVRDVVTRAETPDQRLPIDPTVQAAVDALEGD